MLRRCFCGLALAVFAAPAISAEAPPPEEAYGIITPSIATSLPQYGDPAGIRKWLADRGVTYTLIYINDLLANVRGGSRRGTIDQGKTEAILRVDLEKLAGLQGLSFFANVTHVHNTGRIRRDYVEGINTISNIEAKSGARLSELWLEQKFFNGAASLRIGQLTADSEFFFAESSAMFMQSDWPTIVASDLPSGGPAYPLATPGVRLKLDPAEDVTFQLAVFNGDPAGPGDGDEQERNRHGVNFRVRDPALIMGEAQFRRNQGKDDTGLATTLKLGGWAHLGEFDDQRLANDGSLLANPAGSGEPLTHRGNQGVYAVIDQQLYRPKGGGVESGISVFGRVSVSPSDRNLIDAYLDGGIVFAGMIPGRPNDRFGASVIYARFSDGVRDFDRDTVAFTGVPGPIRDYEANLEFTYVAEIVRGWYVQPTLQHIWHPSGVSGRDATVVGARSIWRF